jgi:hypothetical protein
MDLKSLKELAIAETARHFGEQSGTAPAEDSEEWEDEYRRQFDRLKNSAAKAAPAARPPAPTLDERPDALPKMSGTPADQRWAFTLRSARLKQVQSKEVRDWLERTWIASTLWIDTRELSPEAFLRKVAPHYEDDRKRSTEEAGAIAAAQQVQAAEAAAKKQQLLAAGVSAVSLVELIDVCPRAAAAALKSKLAEIHVEARTLRVFESANPAILMVLEKRGDDRSDYGIERDEGLVSDLILFARNSA